MTKFIPGGPPRYAHQKRGLWKIIKSKGIAALLFDPGTGKTATTLDYLALLALKAPPGPDGAREVRVLVVSPLAAVDTWVLQAQEWLGPQVNFWAEALGGTLLQRGEALAARGGQPYARKAPARRRRGPAEGPRALHQGKALALAFRAAERPQARREDGPDALGTALPRLVIEVVNIDTFSSRARVGSRTMADFMLESVRRFGPEVVVVDESHRIKSASSNASRLLARIAMIVPRRIILTGTVMPHSPLDVFGQWRFLDPTAFGRQGRRATFEEFRRRFAVMGGYMGHEVVGFKNLDEMQDIMAQRAAVATKADALDLPPTTDVTVPVTLTPREGKAYRDMKDALAAQVGTSEAPGPLASAGNRLTQMLRLRQITSGHLPDDQGAVHDLGGSKVATIRSIIEDTLLGENRIVVFGFFTQEIEDLRAALTARPPRPTVVEVIAGGTPAEERAAIRRRFKDVEGHPERIVLVAQIKTLSLAVNELVTASHAIFGSLSQQRDDYVQARDRLSRIGQTRPVTFWHAVAPGTVDAVILQSHRERTDLETAMLRHIREEEA